MQSNAFAFGMLIYELIHRKEPYSDEDRQVSTGNLVHLMIAKWHFVASGLLLTSHALLDNDSMLLAISPCVSQAHWHMQQHSGCAVTWLWYNRSLPAALTWILQCCTFATSSHVMVLSLQAAWSALNDKHVSLTKRPMLDPEDTKDVPASLLRLMQQCWHAVSTHLPQDACVEHACTSQGALNGRIVPYCLCHVCFRTASCLCQT